MAYNFLDDLKQFGFGGIMGNQAFYNAVGKSHEDGDDYFIDGGDYRAVVVDGVFRLDAIAPKCTKDDYVVKVNKEKGILIVKLNNRDEVLRDDDLWYMSDLDIRIELPKNIDYSSFKKEVGDGMLVITAAVKPLKKDNEITVE